MSAAPSGSLLDQLRANPRLPLAIGVSMLVAAVAALWLWNRTPDYGVLYSNLSDRDGGAIIASLQQMNIPYKFAEGGGALMVAANKVPEARLRLASQGLPKGGSAGFELMDNQKFGTSQFVEQVNYQRALEGELARSINSISAVDSARVHLALPKPSLFVREQKSPSASVVLTLHRGRSIDEGQVSAIVHLISSSVPELSAKAVTVVDQAGNLLSAANSGTRGLDVSQLKYTNEIEQGFIRRIEAILQPIVGPTNVRAQVTADIDFSVVEATDEKYRPNQEPGTAAIRSQQSSESAQPGNSTPGGVPGALTNQPQSNPVAPISTAAPGAPKLGAPVVDQLKISTELSGVGGLGGLARSGGSGRKDGTTNYELDRSIRHTQQGAGGIKRLSVAVVVNYRVAAGVKGKPIAQALSATELEQIQNLVKEAMGFSRERGDSVNVVNSAFASDVVETVDVPAWRQAGNIEMAKTAGQYLLLGLLALFVWFSVLRPLLRKHLQPAPAVAPLPGNFVPQPDLAGAPGVAGVQAQAAQREGQRHQENMQYAQTASANDPRMVAMVIQNWMEKT
ncbi:MAG: flagellar M-ring protein FliF [Polaromonas sp. 39-63-203]|jgi:flagellar M-ring protein FliF|uniref:flagellar basal-body MS-ring/collar protein FliF n=1 Tax=Polaromonas sp. TaxID=1869339 RepID=UPI000BD0FAF9|nr:flagellar basal-body MS-ring/collar protein FliF [Polaromonas sp.]OYY53925.1 MAG: flagellar M-ring protein FliF [Polaromonas sp. 35-63-240]OYZ02441.1 MAG: flagellar M-ring protein FliF [Polaromonas sp. 28-63-22]OYZ84916.1 MAG: flagellar M-ring protein FliF [Polaromonas sp. 24-62-144]OZA99000.1 MAG: flagellar M-ring protein FliF [Polaromonas sp. 39-63-203]HQS31592.1 flagellar basal-body MS-ring/collar protein FliF [Polaromonas sp.]